jgi:sulfatase maturation enzyme AslB (radical SAM superfamily)
MAATGEKRTPRITWDTRERVAKENRAKLDAELLAKRLTFESRPYHAHVQFSNFCNMSCVMCWDGGNPPLEKMSPQVLEKLATQVAPSLSVITPHDGSEPLLVSWDETRRIAAD